jgi:hypothetical protein
METKQKFGTLSTGSLSSSFFLSLADICANFLRASSFLSFHAAKAFSASWGRFHESFSAVIY